MPIELTIIENEVFLDSTSGTGPAGSGVPVGGTAGQVLTKASGSDYDTDWEDAAGGGIASEVIFTPAGTIAATDVQAALEELDSETAAIHVDKFLLDGNTAIGATTIDVDRDAGAIAVGTFVGIGAGTTNCEVRRVTAVSGATLTLFGALKVAHVAEENVWQASGFWIPFEWWGARAGVTHLRLLPLADQCLHGPGQLLRAGRAGANSYYSSRPLFINDY